jgi:phosphopantetheine adenylyltransferase
MYPKTIFINKLKLVIIFTKKRRFDHFYVAVIMNFEKIGFFKSNFRHERVKIGQSRGNIKFLEASKDLKTKIKFLKINKNSKRVPPP